MRSVRLLSFITFITVALIGAGAFLPQAGLLRASVTTEEEEEHGKEEQAACKEALPARRGAPPTPLPACRERRAIPRHRPVHVLSSPSGLDLLPIGRRPPLRLLI